MFMPYIVDTKARQDSPTRTSRSQKRKEYDVAVVSRTIGG
jgi:hypothetical protein